MRTATPTHDRTAPAPEAGTAPESPPRPAGPAVGASASASADGPTTAEAPRTADGPRATAAPATRTADDMAVASFVLGLVGLLVFNLVLGPCALVLGGLALARRTGRRGRALLGTALGAADLVVLATVLTADGSVVWNIG
ncbi:DUF4190 domain-containing protein [Streptomyces sp. NHF165]|uniref:DUF4190 domain-containing protein n=1 Tax=Streptomyces sp. NHF165 TaxID=2175864 RepID=UPI00132EC79F|nr:DUF4190 domain-containing protein [Streptomyces sp. NHF165]QHF93575.1 hypothetical protein DEH18_06475 [Streptomyces sp. NHF165]